MSTQDNTSNTDDSSASRWGGMDEEDAERREPRKPLYRAYAFQEHVLLEEHGDRLGDPDGTGDIRCDELFFVRLADAERWVSWQVAQWPPLVAENGYLLEVYSSIERGVFPARDPEWPREASGFEDDYSFKHRGHYHRVSPEQEQLARRLMAQNPSSQTSGD